MLGIVGQHHRVGKNGRQLKVASLALTNPSDCGVDSLTFGARGTLEVTTTDSALYRVDITPPSPQDWTLAGFGPYHAWQFFRVFASPLPGLLTLTCDSLFIQRGSVQRCSVASRDTSKALSGIRWSFSAPELEVPVQDSNSVTWIGEMALSGVVQVRAAMGGTVDSASLAISVQPRQWMRDGLKISPATAPVLVS